MTLVRKIVDSFKIIVVTISSIWATLIYKLFGKKTIPDEEDVKGKVVVITGANRGIGKAVALEFAKRGATVVLGCRDLKTGKEAVDEIRSNSGNKNVVLFSLDLADMESVKSFSAEVKKHYPEIKLLINNAGYVETSKTHQKTIDGFEVHVAINHLGHFLLTNLLLESLQKESKARVISLSSLAQLMSRLNLDDLMMDKADLGLANALPYANTKYLNSLFIKELARKVEGTGVTAYSVCPGYVYTDIYSGFPLGSEMLLKTVMLFFGFNVQQSTQGILHCALSKSVENESGKMYRFKKHFSWANRRLDSDLAEKLWEKSAELVHLNQYAV